MEDKNSYAELYTELFRGMHGLSDYYDLVIVGAGLSGTVIAEQASKRSGLRSLVIDRRNHIGGNCFDYIDEHGIRVSKGTKAFFCICPLHIIILIHIKFAANLFISV